MSGYIYCFSNENMKDTYKIGFTTRCPLMRLREANNGDTWSLTNKFNIEFAKEVSDCREKEKQIHKHLSLVGERVCENREFFKVPLEVIRSVFELIDGIWKIGDAKKIMTELYMSKMDIAEEKFDELKQYLSEITQGRFQWFLDNREEPEVMSEVLKKNSRDVI